MRWGVTFSALLFNLVFTMEVFLLTKNLLTLFIAIPIHGVCALLSARAARSFDLIPLSRPPPLPSYFANFRLGKASSYSPLALDPPNAQGRRRGALLLGVVSRPRTRA